jgi:hypothetical protein
MCLPIQFGSWAGVFLANRRSRDRGVCRRSFCLYFPVALERSGTHAWGRLEGLKSVRVQGEHQARPRHPHMDEGGLSDLDAGGPSEVPGLRFTLSGSSIYPPARQFSAPKELANFRRSAPRLVKGEWDDQLF